MKVVGLYVLVGFCGWEERGAWDLYEPEGVHDESSTWMGYRLCRIEKMQ